MVTQSLKSNQDLFPKVDTAETNNKLQTAQAQTNTIHIRFYQYA